MYVNGMDPYEEAQHIIEVLQRHSSTRTVKMVSEYEATIQIEQKSKQDALIVLEELAYRGYKIISNLKPMTGGGWSAGIRKEIRKKEEPNRTEGFEPGD